jgi:hypothetical protein
MALISVTRLRIRSWRYLLPFFMYALRTSKQAKNSQGNLAVSFLRDADNTFWTRTVWTTESALRSFILSGPHKRVMPRLLEWCDEAAVVHWEQDTGQEPDWQEAHRRLQANGRRSRVKRPSPAHESFEIRPPTLR